MAQALSRDGLRERARKAAYERLFAKLDGLATQHRAEVAAARKGVLEVEGETIIATVGADEVAEGERFVEAADDRAVDADFKAAGRVLTPDLARKYADHIAVTKEDDDRLFDAHVNVAALAQVDGVADDLDQESDQIANKWFSEHRVAIKGLKDERRAVYDEIKGMSPEPQPIEILRPRVRTEETEDAEGNRLETPAGHLMSDGAGEFPVGSLNQWELEVLDTEMARPQFLAWYRNPSRPSADGLTIAYVDKQGNWRRMSPDFVFFHGDENSVKVSIVDPHGYHLDDALPKLRGLAEFVVAHGDGFHRVESIARMADGTLRVLDLKDESVRKAVADARDEKRSMRQQRHRTPDAMSRRLQVLLDDAEFERIEALARRQEKSFAEWVLQSLRRAYLNETNEVGTDVEIKMTALRRAGEHSSPARDINEMLAEIEGGRSCGPAQ